MTNFDINSILRKNKENNFVFDEKDHKYFVNAEEFVSVTKLISKYFVFDELKAAEFVAAKNMTTIGDVLEEWESIRNRGSLIHDIADRFAKKEELSKIELEKIKGVISFFENEGYNVLASEIKVFSKKHKVAGTIDLVLEKEGKVFIADYKTNKKEIVKDDYFDKALDPFSEFPNNKFHIYSMQLSVYSTILMEEYGVDIYDFFVVQLKEEDYKIVSLMDLRYEANMLLDLAAED